MTSFASSVPIHSVPIHSVPIHSVPIHIFILCYNESVILPHTIAHYRKYLPSAQITIYDNESTDNSVEIARNHGCAVISFSSANNQNEYIQQAIRNECWLSLTTGWVLALDMDEWLCITEDQLQEEYERGTSVLVIKGVNLIGESQTEDLSDIDLHAIVKAVDHAPEDKCLCFLRDKIQSMSYGVGGHICHPQGHVQYSERVYINKHMDILGLPFSIKKRMIRYNRTHLMRQHGMDGHYTDDIAKVTELFNYNLAKSYILEDV